MKICMDSNFLRVHKSGLKHIQFKRKQKQELNPGGWGLGYSGAIMTGMCELRQIVIPKKSLIGQSQTQKKSKGPGLDPRKINFFLCRKINLKKTKNIKTVQDSFLYPCFVFFIHYASAKNYSHFSKSGANVHVLYVCK